MTMRQVGPGMVQQVPVKCVPCKGTGSQISDKDKCGTCLAACTVKEKKTLDDALKAELNAALKEFQAHFKTMKATVGAR